MDPYYLVHRAEELGYHPQVILAGRAINDSMPAHVAKMLIMRLNEAVKAQQKRVTVFGQTFVKSLRVRNAPGGGSNCWLTKMDGGIVAVVHDEFRGMGLSGVREFMDEGAVVVDVMVVFEGEGGR